MHAMTHQRHHDQTMQYQTTACNAKTIDILYVYDYTCAHIKNMFDQLSHNHSQPQVQMGGRILCIDGRRVSNGGAVCGARHRYLPILIERIRLCLRPHDRELKLNSKPLSEYCLIPDILAEIARLLGAWHVINLNHLQIGINDKN